MSTVIQITENADQPAARVSALSPYQLSLLLGNALPTVNPLTDGMLWNDSGTVKLSSSTLIPILLSDFANSSYEINSQPAVYADIWQAPDAVLTSVAGQGMVMSEQAIYTTSATGDINMQASAFAEFVPLECTAVFDISLVRSDDAETNAQFYGRFISTIGASNRQIGAVQCGMGGQYFVASQNNTGSVRNETDAPGVALPGAHRLAVNYSAAGITMSVDGGTPFSAVGVDWASVDKFRFSLATRITSPGQTAKTTLAKAVFYSLQDVSALPTLSA